VAVLTAGVEAFMQRLKRLPKDLQLTYPFKTLFEKVSSFKDSIPLFADLKVLSTSFSPFYFAIISYFEIEWSIASTTLEDTDGCNRKVIPNK
jgi:hypothetical protein